MVRVDPADVDESIEDHGYHLVVDNDGVHLLANETVLEALRAGGSAAIRQAQNVEARHGDDTELASMYRSANHFVNDVQRCSMVDVEDEPRPMATGRYADIVLLHSVVGIEKDLQALEHTEGGISNATEAVMRLTRLHDDVYRELKFQDAGAQMHAVGHDYQV